MKTLLRILNILSNISLVFMLIFNIILLVISLLLKIYWAALIFLACCIFIVYAIKVENK